MTDHRKAGVWTTQDVIDVLRALAREEDLPSHLIDGEITANDTVDSLGIDSLGGVCLIERLELKTGMVMPDEFLDLKDNIAEIAERLNRLVESGA